MFRDGLLFYTFREGGVMRPRLTQISSILILK
jgi:hypothetical protein